MELGAAIRILAQRLTLREAITVRRERDGAGHCYFVYDGDRKLAGPFADSADGKRRAQARARTLRARRSA